MRMNQAKPKSQNMPSILKIRIVEARDLPVMDQRSGLTDAYVEIKFAESQEQRTQVAKKTLNPVWNEDFRVEIPDDEDLQDEPIEMKVWDHDVVTQDDVIGMVYVDLNCILMGEGNQFAGWLPIYDSLKGIRGYLNIVLKLKFVQDNNPFKDLSAGVQFLSVAKPPPGTKITKILGFVEELIVDDDPEYHWVDTFRTPRTSNEARTVRFFQMSGKLRRQMGRTVLHKGGNAVLEYRQHLDLVRTREGERKMGEGW
eukprot:TRINITY_DN8149_c0_g1_i4.p2 TRINITY_DN8149_c0_g1~~TRINITY_DN8149_c0_g1_i4.p2  ORF type:complete len:255 (-),score=64.85 TRINITY_DN8149_c0_g1_i4:355-1119(-)